MTLKKIIHQKNPAEISEFYDFSIDVYLSNITECSDYREKKGGEKKNELDSRETLLGKCEALVKHFRGQKNNHKKRQERQ